MIRPLLLASPFLLAACATVPPGDEPPIQVAGEGSCSNAELGRFTGQQSSAQLGAEIQRVSGAKVLQWINPGQAVTMDYREDRVRVSLDQAGRVETARCG